MRNKRSFLLLIVFLFSSIFIIPVLSIPAKTSSTYHLDLWYNNSVQYGSNEKDIAQMLKNQLDATGVFTVTLHSISWSNYITQFNHMPIFLLGWTMNYLDESNYINPFVGSGAFQIGTNYTSSSMAGYLNTMFQSLNSTLRAQAEIKAQSLMAQDVPVLPLFTMTKQFVAYGKQVSGIQLEPSEYLRFNTIKSTNITGIVTIGTTDFLPYLDPANVYDYWGSNMLIQMSHGLLDVPVNGTKAVLGVAKSYSISPDGLTYTFNLKPNLTFTDGSALKVSDVIWSLKRAESYVLNGQPAFLLQNIDNSSYTTINSTAFSFKLFHKDATILQKLTNTNAFIWKQGTSKVTNSLQGFGYFPIGLGPYFVKPNSWTPYNIQLQPYNKYNASAYNEKPVANKGVNVQFLTSSIPLANDVKSGVLDVGFHTFTPEQINSLSSDYAIKTSSMATLGTRFLIINVDAVPQLAVRQAIEYSINRTQFIDQIFNRTSQSLYSMVPPEFPNACLQGEKCAFPSTNITKTKELMAPVIATMTFTTSNQTPGFTFSAILIALPILTFLYKKRKN